MDKTKVLIVGESLHARWMQEAMKRHPAVFDVEVHPFNVGAIGHKPDIVIVDELMAKDYGNLEDRLFANLLRDGWAGVQILDDHEDIKVEVIELRRMQKSLMFPEYYGHRGEGKSMLNALRVKTHFDEKPADHPSRKREPKGPRNKWGKLK